MFSLCKQAEQAKSFCTDGLAFRVDASVSAQPDHVFLVAKTTPFLLRCPRRARSPSLSALPNLGAMESDHGCSQLSRQ